MCVGTICTDVADSLDPTRHLRHTYASAKHTATRRKSESSKSRRSNPRGAPQLGDRLEEWVIYGGRNWARVFRVIFASRDSWKGACVSDGTTIDSERLSTDSDRVLER